MSQPTDPYAAWKALPEESRRPTSWLTPDTLQPPESAVTPEDFTIRVTKDSEVSLQCPAEGCWWDQPIVSVPGRDDDSLSVILRWALDAARDHLDDKEANHTV